MQHKNQQLPAALFGGSWTQVDMGPLDTTMLRYESSSTGFSDASALSRDLDFERKVHRFGKSLYAADFVFGDVKYPIFERGQQVVQNLYTLKKNTFNNLGQTVRLWRKHSHV